jgi:hypothetical protein
MPRAFGFDDDSAYHEALEAHVRAQEAHRRESEAAAKKKRRASLGLPEEGKSAQVCSSLLKTAQDVVVACTIPCKLPCILR